MLLECAERCEQVLQGYFAAGRPLPDSEFERAMVFAVAAMKAAASPVGYEGDAHPDALRLVVVLAGEARDSLRRQGLERELLLCADLCDRAVRACEFALADPQPGRV
jgi:hypothetical protein